MLTLVPLPKINGFYARHKGSKIYSTFDKRSGYYHMALSKKATPKTAFVSPYGKWKFKRCPFGLAQAQAYFQRLVNKVLSCLDFPFSYLDDILAFRPNMAMHTNILGSYLEDREPQNSNSKKVNVTCKKEAYTIPRTYCIMRRCNTPTRKTFQHQKNAPTQNPKRGQTISWAL